MQRKRNEWGLMEAENNLRHETLGMAEHQIEQGGKGREALSTRNRIVENDEMQRSSRIRCRMKTLRDRNVISIN